MAGIIFAGGALVRAQPGWQSVDIGTSTAGSTAVSPETITISASGRDIWNEADGFRFHYREVEGEFDAVVRVRSLTNTHGWAKAAIMARQTVDPGSAQAMICVSAEHGTAFQWRQNANVVSETSTPSEDGGAPRWLKLTRRGPLEAGYTLRGYTSVDGVNWTEAAATSLTMRYQSPLLLGLAVTAHVDGVLCTAQFEQLALTLPPATPSNLQVTHRGPNGQIDLKWTDTSADETGFVIEGRRERLNEFVKIGEVGANVSMFSATGLSEGWEYDFRVKAMKGALSSGFSNRVLTEATPEVAISVPTQTSSSITVRITETARFIGTSGGPFAVERSTDNVNFVQIASGLRQTSGDHFTLICDYDDQTVTPGVPYYYRARYLDTNGDAGDYATLSSPVTTGGSPPSVPAAPSGLVATAVSASEIRLTWTDNATNETDYQIERGSDGVNFGTTFSGGGANQTAMTDSALTASTRYYYRVRAVNGAGASAYSNIANATTPPVGGTPPTIANQSASGSVGVAFSYTIAATNATSYGITSGTLPPGLFLNSGTGVITGAPTTAGTSTVTVGASNASGSASAQLTITIAPGNSTAWQSLDIGTSTAGSTSVAGDTVSIIGSGNDIWNMADGFRFYYLPLDGDGELIVRVASLSNTHGWAKAGVMLRASLEPGSPHAMVCVSAEHGTAFQWRENAGGLSQTTTPSEDGAAPRWLKIARATGPNPTHSFIGSVSSDGVTWTRIGGGYLFGAAPRYIGLVVSSHNDGALCTAQFDHLQLMLPPARPANLRVVHRGPDGQIDLAWDNLASNADRIEIFSRGFFANASWLKIGTVGSGAAQFTATIGAGDRADFLVATYRDQVPSYSNEISVTATISANLAIGSGGVTNNSISLRWEEPYVNQNGAQAGPWSLERSTDGVNFTEIRVLFANEFITEYTDAGLASSTKYYYRVRQLFPNGDSSAYSGVVSATTGGTAPSVPAAPTNLIATALSPTEIRLTWADNATNESGYQIERSSDGTSFANIFTGSAANQTAMTDSGLTASTRYYYRVRAVNASGVSTYSNVADATTQSGTTPGTWQSQDIGAVARSGSTSESNGVVSIDASGADIWNQADEFRYRYQLWTGDGVITARATSLTNTNGWAKAAVMFRESLAANSRHAMMVVSAEHGTAFQNRSATGGESATSPPSESGGVSRWLRLVRAGNVLTGYASLDGVTWTQSGTVTLAGLPAAIYVGLAVTAHNDGALCTAQFDNVTVAASGPPPPPPSPPTAPTNARVIQRGPNAQVDLAWDDNSTNETGFVIEAFQMISSNPDNTWREVGTTGANTTQASIASPQLSPGTEYTLRVKAVQGTASSTYAATSPFTTTATPTLRTTFVGSTSVALEIEARLNQSSAPRINGPFAVERSTNGTTFTQIAANIGDGSTSIASGGLSYTDQTVSPSTQYYYRARYLDSAGNSSGYGALPGPVTTGAATGPAAPSNLAATAVSATEVRLTWTDNANNETAFEIYRTAGSNGASLLTALGVNATSYSDMSVTPGATYQYTVRAINGSGASIFSNAANVTMPSTPGTGPWQSLDIGTSTAGSTNVSGGTVTISGSGRDIWETSDGFRFYYQQETASDFDAVARVISLTNTNGWAKAGVMFRRSLNPGSSFYMMIVSAEHGTAFQSRGLTGEAGTTPPSEDGTAPRWVKISRRGITYTAYTSRDGVTWTSVITTSSGNTSTEPMYVGLAVTSHNDGTLCTAVFDNLTFTPVATTPTPTAPGNLAASAVSPTQITLTWTDNANNETGFEIHRAVGTASQALLATVGANVTTYSDTTVTAGTSYVYSVRAINDSGASSFSNAANVTTPSGSNPWQSRDIGTNIAGSTSEDGGRVTLTGSGRDIWDTSDGFRYRYQPWTGDAEIVARVTGLTNADAFAKAAVMFRESLAPTSRHVSMIATVSHGTALQYRLSGGGLSNTSAMSEVAGPPHWIRLVRRGGTITGYASVDGVAWTMAGSVTLSLDSTIYVGLAVTSHNDGVLSTATFENVTVTAPSAPPGPPPLAPTNLAATARAWDRVDLTWTDNASTETGYEIETSINPDPTWFSTHSNVGANASSATVTGLYPENTFYFRVRAFNASGASAFSNVALATTPAYPAPPTLAAPTNLRATATSVSTIALSWTDNSSSELGFEVGRSTDGVTYDWSGLTAANTTTGQVNGLQANTTYYFQVRAYQSDPTGWSYIHSSSSNTAIATTPSPPPPPTVPAAPTGLAATVISSSQINLTWVDNSNNETGFEVLSSIDRVSYSYIGSTSANVTSYSHTGLAGATTYYYLIRALNSAGPSAYSNSASATTSAAVPWIFRDIGAVGVAGSNTSSGTVITINASGSDIWERADAFRYVCREWTGDGVVEARVGSLDLTHDWAKSGVMIRESLDANAKNVFACLTPSFHGVIAQARSATGDLTSQWQGPLVRAPYSVRITRTGNTFTAQASPDGVNWTTYATVSVAMSPTVYFGFAVTSHDNTHLATSNLGDPFVGTK